MGNLFRALERNQPLEIVLRESLSFEQQKSEQDLNKKSFNALHTSLSLHKIGMEWTKKGIPDHVRGGLCEILASVSERYVRVFRTPLPPFFLLPSRPTIQQVSTLTIFRLF